MGEEWDISDASFQTFTVVTRWYKSSEIKTGRNYSHPPYNSLCSADICNTAWRFYEYLVN
jgi:hypothetical protein